MAGVPRMNRLVLRHGDNFFGTRKSIHVWLTWHDARNANLMILLAYILVGHHDWCDAEIDLFAALPEQELETGITKLNELVAQGRIPISPNHVMQVPYADEIPFDSLVSQHSLDADLVITGLSLTKMEQDGGAFLKGFDGIKDILFVRAGEDILITDK